MAGRADMLEQRRQRRYEAAGAAINAGTLQDVSTADKRRHVRDKLMGEILIDDTLRRSGKTVGAQVHLSGADTRRAIAALAADVRPSARQRFTDSLFVDGAGNLLPSAEKRIKRDYEAMLRGESRAAFEKQRAILTRGSRTLATRQKSRTMHTRAPKMPVRRSSRKPAASSKKMWVPPQAASPLWPHTANGLPPPALAASSVAPAPTCPVVAARSWARPAA
jgi:hypothetical protein